MTWSIVARGPDGEFGIAIASRFFAVGMLCPHARSGVGAVATQALVNPHYGPRGLDLLESGFSPSSVIEKLLSEDEGKNHRQLHMIDAKGRIAAHTGPSCIDWCGHLSGEGYSVAGNMLTGPEVIQSTSEKFKSAKNLPFAGRLIAALAAGEAAGGDKRGKQAAALRIHAAEDYPFLDIRVDDHEDPIAELQRLYRKSLERFQPFATCLPSRARPAGITDRTVIEETVQKFSR
ncbi:MAG TPA: DUF1028 domain-containing protein [Burkholderiales bacterium]|nr:DUF1028 domain-containing protein [Burkholderiales bacterium]